jgi:hypothetical protein
MKTKTLRKILVFNAGMAIIINWISIVATLIIREVMLQTFDNDFLATAISITLVLFVSGITLMLLAGSIIKSYNRKLATDAYDLAHQLHANKKTTPEVFNNMIADINNK